MAELRPANRHAAGADLMQFLHSEDPYVPKQRRTTEMTAYKVYTLLAAGAAAALIAGCGSSEKKAASTTSATTSAYASATKSAYAPSYAATKTTSSASKMTATKAPVAAKAPAAAAVVKISAATVSGLGKVLVNSSGRTLYTFSPDQASKVTCVGSCAAIWPPVKLASGAKPLATGEVRQSLLGSDPDPEGGRVVTYKGWPLYTYVTDSAAGMATGQALNLNGGFWYVIAPSGEIIKKKP
jgi:predicted lipoprotein with Yx(FWY)xxD motif